MKAVLLLLFALLPSVAMAADVPTVTFTISDTLYAPQIDEEIAISINHVAVGTLKVGPGKTADRLTVTVPKADVYHYDLCGHLYEKDAFGLPVTHKIDNGGDLTDLDGRALAGFNAASRVFYLGDETVGRLAVEVSALTAGKSCGDVGALIPLPWGEVAELMP